jgi:hypothetical protein
VHVIHVAKLFTSSTLKELLADTCIKMQQAYHKLVAVDDPQSLDDDAKKARAAIVSARLLLGTYVGPVADIAALQAYVPGNVWRVGSNVSSSYSDYSEEQAMKIPFLSFYIDRREDVHEVAICGQPSLESHSRRQPPGTTAIVSPAFGRTTTFGYSNRELRRNASEFMAQLRMPSPGKPQFVYQTLKPRFEEITSILEHNPDSNIHQQVIGKADELLEFARACVQKQPCTRPKGKLVSTHTQGSVKRRKHRPVKLF